MQNLFAYPNIMLTQGKNIHSLFLYTQTSRLPQLSRLCTVAVFSSNYDYRKLLYRQLNSDGQKLTKKFITNSLIYLDQ